jgi:hypothetical protein
VNIAPSANGFRRQDPHLAPGPPEEQDKRKTFAR